MYLLRHQVTAVYRLKYIYINISQSIGKNVTCELISLFFGFSKYKNKI